jgi:hypothetical protein
VNCETLTTHTITKKASETQCSQQERIENILLMLSRREAPPLSAASLCGYRYDDIAARWRVVRYTSTVM